MRWECDRCRGLIEERDLVIVHVGDSRENYHEKCWKEYKEEEEE